MTDVSRRALSRPGVHALAAALAASLAPQALAAPPPANTPASTLPFAEVLLERLRQNTHRETYIAQTIAPLRQLDTNGDGLDQRDAAREEAITRTRARAQLAEQLLSMDYNGDLKVERAEVMDFLEGDAQRRAAAADAMIQRFDTNRDGAATIAEALATAAQSRRSESSGANVAALLALDPNGDGRLTARELEALAATGRADPQRADQIGVRALEAGVGLVRRQRRFGVAEPKAAVADVVDGLRVGRDQACAHLEQRSREGKLLQLDRQCPPLEPDFGVHGRCHHRLLERGRGFRQSSGFSMLLREVQQVHDGSVTGKRQC